MKKPVKPLRSPPMGWVKFAEAVEAAAKARPKRKGSPEAGIELAKLRGPWQRMHEGPRCQAIAKQTGQRCAQSAMRGGTRCVKHGGRLEVPEHPANAKRAQHYRTRAEGAPARSALYCLPPEARKAAQAAYSGTEADKAGRRSRWAEILEGAQAYLQDDGGRAFRRWIDDINTPRKPEKDG